jgi:IPT/TIG domain
MSHVFLTLLLSLFIGVACTPSENVSQPMSVSSVSPATGDVTGEYTVTVNGSGFTFVESVMFGNSPCKDEIITDTAISCTAPSTISPGEVKITIAGKANRSAIATFTYVVSAPSISSFSPTSGPLAGNTGIWLSGTGFVAGSTVTVGGEPCTDLNVISSTILQCFTPAMAAGSYPVVVTSINGASVSAPTSFSYNPFPTVTSVSPVTGNSTGGETITITGANFLTGVRVDLGNFRCGTVVVDSPTQIRCVTLPSASGVVNLKVTNTDGQSNTLSNAFTFFTPPEITSISPTAGALIGGTSIVITGRNFTSSTAVTIGTASCTPVSFLNSTTISCPAPVNAPGTHAVSVTNPATPVSTLTPGYTYQSGPAVTSSFPAAGPLAGGTTISITGTNFRAGATVTIDGTSCPVTGTITSTSLTCTSPSKVAGTYEIVVTNTDNQIGNLPDAFTYQPAPVITAISPEVAPLAGTSVTITGTNFVAGATVDIGGVPCASAAISSTSITCTAGANTEGVKNVTVTNADTQSGQMPNALRYLNPPVASAVLPLVGKSIGGTTISVSGTDFYTGATVTVGGAECTSPNVLSSTQITCIAPVGAAGPATIEVTNVDGQTSSLAGAFTFQDAPTVSGISPANGLSIGGTSVTISGTGFLNGATVDLGGSACNSPVITASSITCTTSARAGGGVVTVTVTNTDGQSGNFASFTYEPPPVIVSVSPNVGTIAGGTSITITGTGFVAGATVDIGGVPCVTGIITTTSIPCTTGAHTTPGAKTITVTNVDTQTGSQAFAFTYYEAPVLTAVSPNAGPLEGGNSITVTGNYFVGSVVTVDGVNCTNQTIVSPTEISCVLPSNSAGSKVVLITNPDGQSASSSYLYQAAPSVTDVSPLNGISSGTQLVTVNGSNFNGATVSFGGSACAVILETPTSITCTTSAHASGLVSVTVTNGDGQVGSLSNGFTYDPAPGVSSISPSFGRVSGSTSVTITGTNFVPGATVSIGGAACTVSTVSETSISCTTTAGSSGAQTMVVTNPDTQSGNLLNGFTYMNAPTVTGISPQGGTPSGGTTVTITGTNFASGATVSFNGSACNNVIVTDQTSLTCVTPASSVGAALVVITNVDGQAASDSTFFSYAFPPVISSVSTTYGPMGGGTVVNITGTGFSPSIAVKFGSNTATCTFNSSVSLSCTAPASLLSGFVSLTATNPDTQSGTMNTAFYYLANPVITSVSPTLGPVAGGTTITLTGSGFFPGASVTVGGNTCASVNVVSATDLTCVLPPGTAGAATIVVANVDSQTTSLVGGYTYQAAPTVTSISPSNGYFGGGTPVSITGSGFIAGATVKIGLISCVSVNVVSSTQLTCVTGTGSNGTYSVTVTNTDTQSGSGTNLFTYRSFATINSISPSAGTLLGGNTIYIYGSGFYSADTIKIGNTLCSNSGSYFENSSQLKCVVPAQTAGTYDVVVTAGERNVTKMAAYTYREAPTVTSVSPATGTLNGGTSVTITGTGFISGATVAFGALTDICTNLNVVSATTITCQTPAHAVAEPVTVTVKNSDNQTGSLVSTDPGAFTYAVEADLEFIVGSTSPTPPNPDNWGSTTTNITHTFTLKNIGDAATSAITVSLTGTNASAWVIGTNSCSTLAPNASCTVQLTFLGGFLGTGSYVATLEATATSGGTTTNSLQGSRP